MARGPTMVALPEAARSIEESRSAHRPRMSAAELGEVHRRNLGLMMIHDRDRVDDLAVHLQTETVRRARARSGPIPASSVLAEHLTRLAPATRVNAIWGDRDALSGEHLGPRRDFFTELPHAGEFAVIEGAGHWLMYERPAEFEATLLRLVEPATEDAGG